MPVGHSKDSKGCFARWGQHGKKYYYQCRNSVMRKRADTKAGKQGAAVHASGWKEKKK